MDNEDTLAKTTAEQTAAAERTCSGCCYRPNVDILEEEERRLKKTAPAAAKRIEVKVK